MSGNPNRVWPRTFTNLNRSSDEQLDYVRMELMQEVGSVYKEVRAQAGARNGLQAVEREIERRRL